MVGSLWGKNADLTHFCTRLEGEYRAGKCVAEGEDLGV